MTTPHALPRRRARRRPRRRSRSATAGAAATAHLDGAASSTCPAHRRSSSLAAICPIDRRGRRRRRGQPRLVAAGDDLGPRRRGRRPGRRGRVAHRRADRGGRGAGGVQRGPASRSRPPPGAAACAARSVPVHGGVVLDLCGLTRHRRGRRDLARARRARPAPSATTSSTSCAPSTASPSGTGRSRSRCPPSAAGWPAARPASSPPATGRSRTWCSASTWRSPTAADLHRRRAPGRGRARPQPALRGLRGHARHHHRRPAAPAPGAHPRAPGGLRVRVLRRRRRRHATDHAARRHPRRAAPLRPGRGRPHLPHRRPRPCCSCSTRATAAVVDTDDGAGRRGAAATRRPPTSAHVAHWLEQRNDVAALEALITPRLRGRHDGGGRSLARPARDLRRHDRRAQRRRGHGVGLGAPVPQLHRRRLPLLHLRGQGGARRPRPLLPSRVGRRHPAVLAAGGALSHHHGVGLNRSRFVAEALGPASTCSPP